MLAVDILLKAVVIVLVIFTFYKSFCQWEDEVQWRTKCLEPCRPLGNQETLTNHRPSISSSEPSFALAAKNCKNFSVIGGSSYEIKHKSQGLTQA